MPEDSPPRRERRGFRRTAFSILVQLSVLPDDHVGSLPDDAVGGITADLSRGGFSAWIGDRIPVRSRCVVRFLNPRGRVSPDTMWGVVRRIELDDGGCLIGVEFDTPLETFQLSPKFHARLALRENRNARVLVADDQAEIRDLLERFLTTRGFDVQVASDGHEALEAIRQEPPDVLLLDVYMPRVDGHEVLRTIREESIPIDVICTISGYATDDDAQECLRLGAADHIAKPVDLDYLDWNLRLRLGAGKAP